MVLPTVSTRRILCTVRIRASPLASVPHLHLTPTYIGPTVVCPTYRPTATRNGREALVSPTDLTVNLLLSMSNNSLLIL